MKILLIGNYPGDQQPSMRKYSLLLQRKLLERGVDASLVFPAQLLWHLPLVGGKGRKWLAYVDKYVVFIPRLRNLLHSFDLVHVCDHSNALYLRFCKGLPTVITCHDLIAIRSALGEIPEYKTRLSGRILQSSILNNLKYATRIVCDSSATQSDVRRIIPIARERVSMAHIAFDYPFTRLSSSVAQERLGELFRKAGAKFFIHVGSEAWYKNRSGVVALFAELARGAHFSSFNLVFVGPQPSENLLSEISHAGLFDRVLFFSEVSDELLEALYSLAYALLFPSLYEGFGWPIIEAQSCGCPVVTSDRPPMPEVAGDAAIFIDPFQPVAAAAFVSRELTSSGMEKLIERGFNNAKRFSAEEMADRLIAIYKSLLSENRKKPEEEQSIQ